jgi:bacterioferritin
MKEKKEIVQALNLILADELSAISQYLVHSEMYDNSGYINLNMAFRKQAADEMNHSEWLIERSVFFEGKQAVTKLNTIKIGKNAAEIINVDNRDEIEALDNNKVAIKLAREAYAQGTMDLMTRMNEMEENHVNWAEIQFSQIEQIGLENYLIFQTKNQVT